MINMLKRVFGAGLLLAVAALCHAQGIANLYVAGGSYNPGGSPQLAGTALYAHQINTSGTYAFTLMDAIPSTVAPYVVTTSVGAGIAQKIATIGGVPIFIPTAAGISYTSSNMGWAWTTGMGVPIRFKPNWYVMPIIRVLKSSVSGGSGYQPIIGVLIGWGK